MGRRAGSRPRTNKPQGACGLSNLSIQPPGHSMVHCLAAAQLEGRLMPTHDSRLPVVGCVEAGCKWHGDTAKLGVWLVSQQAVVFLLHAACDLRLWRVFREPFRLPRARGLSLGAGLHCQCTLCSQHRQRRAGWETSRGRGRGRGLVGTQAGLHHNQRRDCVTGLPALLLCRCDPGLLACPLPCASVSPSFEGCSGWQLTGGETGWADLGASRLRRTRDGNQLAAQQRVLGPVQITKSISPCMLPSPAHAGSGNSSGSRAQGWALSTSAHDEPRLLDCCLGRTAWRAGGLVA